MATARIFKAVLGRFKVVVTCMVNTYKNVAPSSVLLDCYYFLPYYVDNERLEERLQKIPVIVDCNAEGV